MNDSLQLTPYTVPVIIIMSASPGSTIRSFICESLTPTAQHKSSVRKPGQLCELNADTHNEEQPDIIKSFKPVRNREREREKEHFSLYRNALFIFKQFPVHIKASGNFRVETVKVNCTWKVMNEPGNLFL